METLYLVGCAQTKQPGTHPARQLYVSPLFRLMRAYAESQIQQEGGSWLILSAKYGLLRPHQTIENYNLSLTSMGKPRRQAWALWVLPKLEEHLMLEKVQRIVWLCGVRYRELLEEHLSENFPSDAFTQEAPLKGMGIGQQLAWLKGRVGR